MSLEPMDGRSRFTRPLIVLSICANIILAVALVCGWMYYRSLGNGESQEKAAQMQSAAQAALPAPVLAPGQVPAQAPDQAGQPMTQPPAQGQAPAPAAAPGQGQPAAVPVVPVQPHAAGAPETLPSPENTKSYCGPVKGGIYESLLQGREKFEAELLTAHVCRSLMWKMDPVHDFSPGDELRVLYEYDGKDPESMKILVISVEHRSGQKVVMYRFKGADFAYASYFDRQGQEIQPRLANCPVKSYEAITALAGEGRGRHKIHMGLDLKMDIGTPVSLPYKATVLRKNWNWHANGDCVEVQYAKDGYHAAFLHMSKVDPAVEPGKILEAGTKIGESGNTGLTTGPHLHYMVMDGELKGGKLIDPLKYQGTVQLKLRPDEMAAFGKNADAIDASLKTLSCSGSKTK